MSDTEATAECRGCGMKLRGKPYHMGGVAYLPLPKGGRAPVNYYGGYVCSYRCDRKSSLELEGSMPGHGYSANQTLDRAAAESLKSNWPDE